MTKLLRRFALLIFFAPLGGFAAAGLTLQGRITLPSGLPLNEDSVLIKAQLLTPDSNECLLFEEVHSTNLSATEGLFSIILNQNGTRTDGRTWSFADSLSNSSAFSFSASSQCASGSGSINYTPSASDERKIALYFKRQSMADWEEMTDPNNRPTLTHSAYSQETRKVTGFGIESLCRVADAGVPQSVAALSSANFTELLSLINGSSTQYVISSSTGGAGLPSFAGNPASSSEGAIWYDSSNKRIMFNDGTGTPKTVGSTSTSVTAGGQTGALSVGTTDANSFSLLTNNTNRLTVTADGKIGIGTASPAYNLDVAGLAQFKSSSDTTPAIRVLNSSGGLGGGLGAASGQLRFYDATSNFRLILDSTKLKTVGSVLAVADGSQNIQAVISYSGSSYFNGGNVGIGTTSPAYKLDVQTGVSSNSSAATEDYGLQLMDLNTAYNTVESSGVWKSGILFGLSQFNGQRRQGSFLQQITTYNNFSGGSTKLRTNLAFGTRGDAQSSTSDLPVERMRIMHNGNVGIGTSSPVRKLDLLQTDSNNALLRLSSAPSVSGTSYEAAMEFYTTTTSGSTSPLLSGRIASNFTGTSYANTVLKLQNAIPGGTLYDTMVLNNGNVGIGTATPGKKLDVAGTILGQNSYFSNYGSTGSVVVGIHDQTNGFYAPTTNTLGVVTNSTERIRIDSSGNVGIGTSAPGYLLDIQSSSSSSVGHFSSYGGDIGLYIQTSSVGSSNISTGSAYDGLNWLAKGTAASIINSNSAGTGDITFSTNSGLTPGVAYSPAERMRITNSGNIGIGTTSPGATLHVNGTLRFSNNTSGTSGSLVSGGATAGPNGIPSFNFQTSRGTVSSPTAIQSGDAIGGIFGVPYDGTAYKWNAYFGFVADTGSQGTGVSISTGTGGIRAEALRVSSTGNVGIGTASPSYKLDVNGTIRGYGITDSSDLRLKRDIRPLQNDFDKILQLQGVSYYWSKQEHGNKKQIGVIAQDIERFYPELVETDKDGLKSVNYSHFIAPLIEAFKTLAHTIISSDEQQNREIVSLKQELESKNRNSQS